MNKVVCSGGLPKKKTGGRCKKKRVPLFYIVMSKKKVVTFNRLHYSCFRPKVKFFHVEYGCLRPTPTDLFILAGIQPSFAAKKPYRL